MTPTPPVPARASDVTAEWLAAALDTPLGIERVEPAGQEFGLASERVRVRLTGDGAPSSVVVKLWGFEDPSDACEVPFYPSLAPRCGIRLPACLHAALDERLGRAVLVLEDLRGAAQGDCLERPTRKQAVALAETLGTLHASWWERSELRDAAAWLPEATVERSREWIESRAPEFLLEFDERLTPHARDLFDRGAELQADIHGALDNAPVTLLHGDLHLDNVLFERESGRPVLLDWGRAARGPYALDLADLLFGVVAREDRAPALRAYAFLVRARGAAMPEGAALRRHLDAALLRFFYRSTCGVVRWKPGTERERRMRVEGVDRAIAAVAEWREEAQDQGPIGTKAAHDSRSQTMETTVTSHAKQEYLYVYDREHATTMKVLRAYPEDQLDFKPHPKSNSARQLAWIFVLERGLGTMLHEDAFAKEPPSGSPPPPPDSWKEQLDALERASKDYRAMIESTPEEKLSETVRFFVGPKTMGDIPRMAICWFLLHDQIHHRGQFSVYLRMVGGKVPSIYGPSLDESWW